MAMIAVIGLLLGCLAMCLGQETAASLTTIKMREDFPLNLTFECTQPQKEVDTNQILGLWKVVEVIEHSANYKDRRNYLRPAAESCPKVIFSTDSHQMIRMQWNEEAGYIQFDFRMNNLKNPGFLLCVGWQSGTLVDENYTQFSGTVLVTKSDQSLLVLTFCSPEEKHFSVILARNFPTQEEIQEVHKVLVDEKLQLTDIVSYCNSGALNVSSLAIILLAITITCRNWF